MATQANRAKVVSPFGWHGLVLQAVVGAAVEDPLIHESLPRLGVPSRGTRTRPVSITRSSRIRPYHNSLRSYSPATVLVKLFDAL